MGLNMPVFVPFNGNSSTRDPQHYHDSEVCKWIITDLNLAVSSE